MRKLLFLLEEIRKSDYRSRTFFYSACSVLSGIGFALFNGALGIIYQSVWNGTICAYYVLLAFVRGLILLSQRRNTCAGRDRKVYIGTHVILIFTDLCLGVPIACMITGQRNYTFGLIPAIATAAYTAYRITMAAVQYASSRKHESILVKELRVINLQDALVSVLTLQNALIIAVGNKAESMISLTGWTGAGIWLLILWFTVRSFLSMRTQKRD